MRALGLAVVVGMLALVVGVRLARSQAPAATPGMPAEHTAMTPSDLKWGDPPPVLPKGAQMAVLAGDPTKAGLFVVRLKMPAGYKIMPHSHPTDENITVISGLVRRRHGRQIRSADQGAAGGQLRPHAGQDAPLRHGQGRDHRRDRRRWARSS